MRFATVAAFLFSLISLPAHSQIVDPGDQCQSSFNSTGINNCAWGTVLPCDVVQCVAAHSVTRQLSRKYAGPLFQIVRGSDAATTDISALSNGQVNQSAITTFCAATTCNYSKIYDQAGNGNDLPQATTANQTQVAFTSFAQGTLPMVATLPYQFYRNRTSTKGIPSGNSSITVYDVVNTFGWSECCGTYGDMEATVSDNGNGHMFAMGFGTGGPRAGTGNGPWPAVDWENGFYSYGATPSTYKLAALTKYNAGATTWTFKSDPGVTGAFITLVNAETPPDTAAFEGGLSLGEGGDGTPAPTGFFEGIVVAAPTTDAQDNAIAANVHNFYAAFGAVLGPKQVIVTDVGNNNAVNPVTVNPSSNIPAGSLGLLIGFDVSLSAGTTGAVTDTQGNTWTLAASVNTPTIGYLTLFYCQNCKALSTSDTITYTDINAVYMVADVAWSTNIAASALDSGVTNTASGASGTPVIPIGTPTAAGDLIVGAANSGNIQMKQNYGWITSFSFAPGSCTGCSVVAGQIVNGTSSASLSYAPFGGASSAWTGLVAGFKHN